MRKKPPSLTVNDGPLIGAHESIAGGLHTAFERAASVGCRALQIFTKNSNRWDARPLSAHDIANYKTSALKSTIRPVIAHSSYLINLCARDLRLLNKSRRAFVDELARCETLSIPYLNFHPGSHTGAGASDGIKRIIESLDRAHEETEGFRVLSVLETTAGQGTSIGHRFEQLRQIIDGAHDPERISVCIDTCHIFAAGYDISTETGYQRTMDDFLDIIGLDKLVVIHANDSKKGLGSRVDRHEHIGRGAIGRVGFRCLMRDERLRKIPKIIETPKGVDLWEDKMNLGVLNRLFGR